MMVHFDNEVYIHSSGLTMLTITLVYSVTDILSTCRQVPFI